MTNAHPSVVGTQVGNRNATQMSTDCRTHQNLGISSGIKTHLTCLVQKCCFWEFVFLLHFLSSESTNEYGCAVPYDLKDLSWRDFGDIDLKIGVAIISGPAVESADDCNCVKSGKVGHSCVVDCAQHVNLSPANISFVLVVDSVFVKPVVEVGLEVDMISEVSWPG